MPIYEFQCRDCDAVFEILTASAASGGTAVCPQCKSEQTKKILSAGSFKSHKSPPAPACGPSSGCAQRRGFS